VTAPGVDGVVHIAGLVVTINQQMRQRCSWCGATLLDYDLSNLAVPVGQDPTPAHWPVGDLVLVDGGLSVAVVHTDGDELPAIACGRIDPAVTR
jgi:hypothetical protein